MTSVDPYPAPGGGGSISDAEVGPAPPPSVEPLSAPAGYDGGDDPTVSLQIEITDPHRAGEGLSKHVEYVVTYWTSGLPKFASASGRVARRYSEFEWLWRALSASADGVLVPALPGKTLSAPLSDDPGSVAIERRRRDLGVFVARIARHPLMRASDDVRTFLEEKDRGAWKERVPWHERGVTSDAIRATQEFFGGAANARASSSASASSFIDVPNAPNVTNDGIVEDARFVEIGEYVGELKQRVDALLEATTAVTKHHAGAAAAATAFAAACADLDDAELRACANFRAMDAASATVPIRWSAASALFAASAAPSDALADAVADAFREPLRAASALCASATHARDRRRQLVDAYNKLCAEISAIDAKIVALGVPELGSPKRMERDALELRASDARIARTHLGGRYSRAVLVSDRELCWFHGALAASMGDALKAYVASHGAAAGRAARALADAREGLRDATAAPPDAFLPPR